MKKRDVKKNAEHYDSYYDSNRFKEMVEWVREEFPDYDEEEVMSWARFHDRMRGG